MRIGVLGINHKTADLTHREWLAKACYKRLHPESAPAQNLSLVCLLTCHRSEVYFSAHDLAEAHSLLLHVLREEIPFPFEHKLYAYFGSDCFEHLAQVTAGLDSMVLAESEIQGQVKQAYEKACLHYTLPSAMHFLFQKSLKLGKHVRAQSVFPKGHLTIPKIVCELSQQLCGPLPAKKILFIGNSEINRKVLSLFKHKGVEKLALCTRSLMSARDLAFEQGIELFDWAQLKRWGEYDIVIAGTNASSYLVQPQDQEVRTELVFDLGVPRNVDPRLGRHPRLALLNIDELGQMLEGRQSAHLAAIRQSTALIEEKVLAYVNAFQARTLHAVGSGGRE
jgi:glutamyl-tRNA reductase